MQQSGNSPLQSHLDSQLTILKTTKIVSNKLRTCNCMSLGILFSHWWLFVSPQIWKRVLTLAPQLHLSKGYHVWMSLTFQSFCYIAACLIQCGHSCVVLNHIIDSCWRDQATKQFAKKKAVKKGLIIRKHGNCSPSNVKRLKTR